MKDLYLTLLWLGVLGGGAALCVLVRGKGLRATYVRDLLHIGTGLWVFGLPFWEKPTAPVIMVGAAFLAVLSMPFLRNRVPTLGSFYSSVSDEEERWSGIVVYVFSFALFTVLGFHLDRLFAAACAMGSLAVGDGLGGLLGSGLGRRRYRLPWAKEKSYLGSLAVALGSLAAILIMACWFRYVADLPIAFRWGHFAASAFLASAAEAVSPLASDNFFLPATVFLYLALAL